MRKRQLKLTVSLLLTNCAAIGLCALANLLYSSPAAAQAAPQDPVSQEFPSQSFPANLPDLELSKYFPQQWQTYAYSPERNPAFALPKSAPEALRNGVEWTFAGAGAIPLDGPPLAGDLKVTAYTVGMPVGVTVVKGVLYVGDDNGYTYAVNAITGKLIWAHYGWNMTMSNPLVDGDRVIISTGNPYFNYEKTMKYIKGERTERGPGLNSVFALDRTTGKELWAFHPPGEVMPTPVDVDGFLYVGTGDGNVYKVDIATGKLVWKTEIQSFVSMSSPVAGEGKIFLGGTYPNQFYALDQATGRIVWQVSIPKLVATGISDCTPAYASGIVVQEVTIESGDQAKPAANVLLAIEAKSGKILWQHRMDYGPVPPAMKTATPMIHAGMVYEGSPVSGNFYAFDLQTGRQLWTVHLGSQLRAGAAMNDGIAYLPYQAGEIAAIRISDGKIVGKKHIGGAFGPSTPVIIGETLYVSNIYGWVHAVPLNKIRNGTPGGSVGEFKALTFR